MTIRAYINLQDCRRSKTSAGDKRRAFVDANRAEHGIAKGAIHICLVQGKSWAHIRRVMKRFEVMGYTKCGPTTVLGYSKDLGNGYGRLHQLSPDEIPEAMDSIIEQAVREMREQGVPFV